MADDQSQDPQAAAGPDPLAQLEELLKKTKTKQGGGGAAPAAQPPTEPQPDPAQVAAELEAAQAAGEELRQKQLAEHQEKFSELQDTPQYHARIEHREHEQQEKQTEQDANSGHEIRQISETRITE